MQMTGNCKTSMLYNKLYRWMLNDPEQNIEQTVELLFCNMRSKGRWSHVLQFTFRRAVSCVLHRPPSLVIHCTMLYNWGWCLIMAYKVKLIHCFWHPTTRVRRAKYKTKVKALFFARFVPWLCQEGTEPLLSPPASTGRMYLRQCRTRCD